MEAERSPDQCPPPSTGPYPWLLFWHGEGNEHQIFCTITESGGIQVEPRTRSIPELQGKDVICCSCGWLVLLEIKDELDHCSLWNPSTLESITLPPRSTTEFTFCSALLTSPPSTTNSWLLLFDHSDPNILFIRLDCDDRQWVEKSFEEQMESMELLSDEFENPFTKTCCSNGIVVCMTKCHEWLALDTDPDDGPVNLRTLKSKPFGGRLLFSTDYESYLVEFQGHVFCIDIFFSGVGWDEVIRIEIFRLNLETEEWENVESANDQVFFLGHNSYGVCCPTLSSDKERGGRIFFFFDDEKLIYSYNIAKRSLSIAFRFPDLHVPCSTPAWVMPNYRMVADQVKIVNEVGKKGEIDQEGKRMVEIKCIEESGCNGSKEIDLLRFPQTVMEELADHLLLLDYMNFRVVCREFSVAAPAITWRETLKTKSAELCLLPPCLMFVGEDQTTYNLIDTKYNGRYFMRTPDELEDATICSSKNGWLLMRNKDGSMFFYNPFTKVVLRCPDEPDMYLPLLGFVLSSAPTSSECLVVGIANRDNTIFLQILGYPHDEVWTTLNFPYESDFEPNSPVFWNGAFYFLGEKGNLGVLRQEEAESYIWDVLDILQPPCEAVNQNFLVECDEDLLSIFVGDYGKWVRVFRLDQSGLVWNEVYSLGNKTLYLSRSSSFSTVAMYKEMENRIYFPRLHRESLVFYSLETQKLHSSNCLEDSLVDFCGTSEQLLCGWIEPRWP